MSDTDTINPDTAAPAAPDAPPARTAALKVHATGGISLAMAVHQWQAIEEKEKSGKPVDTAEYVAAAVNTGSTSLDTVGLSLDGMASSQLGRLAPRLERAGGPLVQAVLAAPSIAAAVRSGDTEQIGSATFGAIGGVAGGLAGQAIIPIPIVGFVAGVVAGDAAAKVGGLATTAIYNSDPAKREHAIAELKQIAHDYVPNPLDPTSYGSGVNLAGAAVSSLGRAGNTLGQVADWSGSKLDGMAVSAQHTIDKSLQNYVPPVVAEAVSEVIVAMPRAGATLLRGAGKVVAAVGDGVDAVGKAMEDTGHHINKGIARFQDTYSQEYAKNREKHGPVQAAATAAVAATVDVADKAKGYVEHRASQAVAAVSSAASQAKSWYASHAPSWLGGNGGEAIGGETMQQYLNSNSGKSNVANLAQQLNNSGWARAIGNHDSKATEAELAAYLKTHANGKAVDANHDGKISGGELQSLMQRNGDTVDKVLRKEVGGLIGQMNSTGWSTAVGNHDSKATIDEVMATLKEHKITMQSLDKNNDGHVSGGELQRGLQTAGVHKAASAGRG